MAKRPSANLDSIGIPKTSVVVPHRPFFRDPEPLEPRKSLTLKLIEDDYERLRRYAFETKKSHQTVLREAVMEKLDKEGA